MEPNSSNVPVFHTYTDFAAYLKDRKCPKCNAGFIQSNKDVEGLFQSWLNGRASVNSHIKCQKCSKVTCIACSAKTSPTVIDVNGIKVSWCCSRGRLFVIWVLLCGYDQEYCNRKRRETATNCRTRNVSSGGGVGYSSWSDRGGDFFDGGFGGGDPYGQMQKKDAPGIAQKAKAESAEKKSDRFDTTIFSILATLCPSPGNDSNDEVPLSSFDVRPPKAVVSMLVNSKILNKAAELLRNDSLDNATQRTDLYMALIAFLKRVGVHEVSKQEVIFDDRVVMPDNVNLLTLSFSGAPSKTYETASSLADGLRRLNIQSDMMMRGAQKARNEFKDQQGQDMLWLCREISDLSTHLQIEEWWTQVGGHNSTVGADHGIVEVADDQMWGACFYAREAQSLTQSPAGRIRRLITEITSLKTGLSSGIYVKHAISRLDVMKFLIVGPQGTPYENGLFEFDLWCPREYPHVPPKVRFNTRGCMFSMNPNLHPDGKVCLSLLGTWESGHKGEEWQPGQSTILQILISIQAMVFCEDPVRNEPGFGSRAQTGLFRNNTRYSEFSKAIRSLVVKYGMLEWAQDPPLFWKDISDQHFRKNGDRILQTVERWMSEARQSDMGGYDRSSMLLNVMGRPAEVATLVPNLHVALKKYGATYVPQNMGSRNSQPFPSRGDQAYGGRGFFFGGGGSFDGPGGKRSYGYSPGSRYGRGW
ncbi:Nn.00g036260.m01.CDS01 [Neocucurbitaria sp. VM-36]